MWTSPDWWSNDGNPLCHGCWMTEKTEESADEPDYDTESSESSESLSPEEACRLEFRPAAAAAAEIPTVAAVPAAATRFLRPFLLPRVPLLVRGLLVLLVPRLSDPLIA